MENPPDHPRSKRTLRRNNNSQASMSDSDSTGEPYTWHSPMRSDSPFRFDDPSFQPENDKDTKSLVYVGDHSSPVPSPGKPNLQTSSPAAGVRSFRPWPRSEKHASENTDFPAGGGNGSRRDKSVSENHGSAATKSTSPMLPGLNRLVSDESMQVVKKVGAGGGMEEGYPGEVDAVDGERASLRTVGLQRAALMFRVFEMAACLTSFSVMAADKTQGWSGDSFDRYIEYRYCLGVNIIGFVYSGLQALVLACHLATVTGKHLHHFHFHFHFDFLTDQILAYLLLSASSCAATRVTDWISNWGKDDFTLMASASIAMSFLAFIAFAFSSIISGYNLCNRN